MKTLLITGIDGVVGSNLVATLADRAPGADVRVIGTSRLPGLRLDGVEVFECNLFDAAAVDALLQSERPDAVVHCGPLSQASWDLADQPAPSGEVQEVANLAQAAAALGSHFTLISTAAVFSGPTLFHQENDKIDDRSEWGSLASQIERSLPNENSLVVRSDAYGWSPAGNLSSFAETLYDAIDGEVPIRADGLRYATPILATDLAEHLWQAISRQLTGTLHICGAERTSPYRFACELAKAMERHLSSSSTEESFEAEASGETSLNTYRARRELETAMPLLRDGLAQFCEQAASGYRDRIAAISGAPIPAPHFSMAGHTVARGKMER